MQILIIDDDTANLKRMRETFSKEGYGIITVSNSEQAENIISKIEIDFVCCRVDQKEFLNQIINSK